MDRQVFFSLLRTSSPSPIVCVPLQAFEASKQGSIQSENCTKQGMNTEKTFCNDKSFAPLNK